MTYFNVFFPLKYLDCYSTPSPH